MMANAGYIKLFRQLTEWEWYQDANVMRLFLHLLLTVNYENKRWQGKDIKRGQVVTSIGGLASSLGLTNKQIRLALDKLSSTNEIIKVGTNKYTIITICKYDDYQSEETNEGQTKDIQKTNEGQTKDIQRATTKEGKEYNNISLSLGADEKIFEEDEKKRDQDTKWIGLMKMPFTTWVEDSCRLLGLNKEELNMYIDTFSLEMKAKCTYHNSWQDITSHFISWVKCEREKHKKQNNNNGSKIRQNDDRRPFEPSETANYHSQI